jgi:titin
VEVINAHSCSVLISDLRTSPYHLAWGSSVWAQVTATNIKGDSVISQVGNGAIILTVPGEPTALANVPTVTNAIQVGLEWTAPSEDGGSVVIDYKVLYGEQTGSYNNEIAGITTTSFTVIGLTTGTVYKFKVQARNEYGYSTASDEEFVLAAQKPDVPQAPTTTVVDLTVEVAWS